MGLLMLVTGGARSGKSAFAEERANQVPGKRMYLATSPRCGDHEMEARIARHQRDRAGTGWITVEEQLDLVAALGNHQVQVIIIDCLTLWVNNLLYHAEVRAEMLDEDMIRDQALSLVLAVREQSAQVIMVTNEVGLGIVPDNPRARIFRDLAGRCNQTIGRAADEVYLVTCGISHRIR